MREILESCVRIDELAHSAYIDMARRCTDAHLARVLGQMAAEEAEHVGWWTELLAAWSAGLLPDIWAGHDETLVTLRGIIAEIERAGPVGEGPLTAEQALTAAVRIEFFALDPLFAEVIDLTEPAVARTRRDAYSRHVEGLIAAIEQHFPAESLAGFLAGVLRRTQRENRVLARYAARDPLTGLGNRRALNAQMLQWSAWAARYGRPIALIFADIDNFKGINDRCGHSVGDEALKLVADAIARSVRDSDLAVRLGGDEFAVLAPELEVEGARALAARIVEAVRAIRFAGPAGSPVTPTVSVGVVVASDPPDAEPRSVDHLLAAADHSLYAAKLSGRDRAAEPVVLAASAR